MPPRIADACVIEFEKLRATLDEARRTAASLEAVKARAARSAMTNAERRALLKALFAKEQEP